MQTVRHFFPSFNRWCDQVPDGRDQEAIIYDRRFLIWWGVLLYLLQFGSRRQLDFELDQRGTKVLNNLNRLAETKQDTRPVHDTLDYFLEHSQPAAFAKLRTHMVQRLVRMKVLDAERIEGHLPIVLDGSGHLSFSHKHCDQCLVRKHEKHTQYLHQILEAKLLGPAGVTLSCASAFIENADSATGKRPVPQTEQRKQDCELKALDRLVPELQEVFPQARLVLLGDALFACGRVFQIAKDNHWRFLFTFKEGRLPAVWKEFQTLLQQSPQQVVTLTTPDGIIQEYRWMNDLSYTDDQGRTWTFHALQLVETTADGTTTTFAWITDLPVDRDTVVTIAQGGRKRWRIENQGFNRQKNSGLNLEHVYSIDPNKLKAYYYLLQIAHIFLQLFECSSLLRASAAQYGRQVLQLFGSLKNMARRLLECFRYQQLSDDVFDSKRASRLRVRLDSS